MEITITAVESSNLLKVNLVKRQKTLEQRVTSLKQDNDNLKKREDENSQSPRYAEDLLGLKRAASARLQAENKALKADLVEAEKTILRLIQVCSKLTAELDMCHK
jgi:cell division septum initiation protein DivIVA